MAGRETEAEDGQRSCRRILEDLNLAVVIHISRLPSHGRETVPCLRTQPAGKTLPIFFVDGKADVQRKANETVQGALFVTQETLPGALADLARAS